MLERVSHTLGLLPKPKAARTSATIPPATIEKIQKFYTNDEISWQAPGKRDTKTVKENGVNVKYQKRHLLYNIREVYELFIQENPGKRILCLFETHGSSFISNFFLFMMHRCINQSIFICKVTTEIRVA